MTAARVRKFLPGDPILVGLYARLSDADVDQLGTDDQIKDLRRRIAAHLWMQGRHFVIVDVYVDKDITAADYDVERPDFERAVRDLQSGRINVIAARDFDRLWRSNYDFNRLLREMTRAGSAAMLALEGDPRLVDIVTREGVVMAQIKGAMAEEEVHKTKGRITFRHSNLAESGAFSGGTRRFGYNRQMDQTVPAEAAAIQDAANRVLAGTSLSTIAREWNAKGLRTAGADRWHAGPLRNALARPAINSEPEYVTVARELASNGMSLKHICQHFDTQGIEPPPTYWKPQNVRRVLGGPHVAGIRTHHGKQYKALWPAILDVDTHTRLRVLFEDPMRVSNPGGNASKYALTGRLRCGKCGSTLYTRWVQNRRVWGCVRVSGGCGALSRRADPLEEWVVEELLAMFRDQDYVTSQFKKDADDESMTVVLAELRASEALLEEVEVARWMPKPGERAMKAEMYERVTKHHQATIEDCKRRLASMRSKATIDVDLVLSGDLDEQWEDLELAAQQALLGFIAHDVTVLPVGRGVRVTEPEQSYRVNWKDGATAR